MATWSQSHFLQALGWATLNSLWQMALLWCVFSVANYFYKLSATRKYQAAVSAILFGFAWFVTTLVLYYQNNSTTYAFFENTIAHSNSLLHICLFAASLTYLILLVFPAVRLLRNWQVVQRIKKQGHSKAQFEYRLFVQHIAAHLGITKKVKLFVSELVSSPVTIGYLKPIILLPVAAMNHLSTAQVEAILLHELSHIRRYDYLLNLIVSIVHTLLYFNPFVKAFLNVMEAEREACCDELVLQFGYDKIGYASALLHLEKNSRQYQALALAAAGKQNLLTRIEKIVGMEKKKTFRLVQIVPLLLAMVCIILFNSVLIIKDAKSGEAISYTSDTVFTPWQWNNSSSHKTMAPADSKKPLEKHATNDVASATKLTIDIFQSTPQQPAQPEEPATVLADHLMPVNFDEVDGSLSNEEKENVKTTVEATKKIASTLQWKEIENSIGEVMNQREKEVAKQEYLHELNNVPWNYIEQNMKANYDRLNWNAINENVNKALVLVQIDSLQTVYSQALSELERSQRSMREKVRCTVTPMPDASLEEIQQAKETLKKNLDSLKAARPKKIIQL